MTARESWHRQPSESGQAYEALKLYLEMGHGRSTAKVAERLKKNHYLMQRWSAQWCWVSRAEAYDNHAATVEMDAMDRSSRGRVQQWVRRRERQIERDWDLSQRFLARAAALARFPVERVTRKAAKKAEDGKEAEVTEVYEPISTGDLKRAAEIAEKGQVMAWSAIAKAIPNHISAEVALEGRGDGIEPTVQEQASKEIGAWQASMREKLLSLPSSPPIPDTPATGTD